MPKIQDQEISESPPPPPSPPPPSNTPPIRVSYSDYQVDWLEKTRGNLMIVATVIASMAFQAAVNPPNELWNVDSQEKQCKPSDILSANSVNEAKNLAITCINKYNSHEFIICNSVSFSASLSIIFLLTVLPLRHKFSLWIMLLAISVTLFFTSATYIVSISMAKGPNDSVDKERFNNEIVFYYIVFWVGLLAVVVLLFVLRFVFWLLMKLIMGFVGCCNCMWRRKKRKVGVIGQPATRV